MVSIDSEINNDNVYSFTINTNINLEKKESAKIMSLEEH